jgi:multicomponent Na+:H+ antiporter subunit E
MRGRGTSYVTSGARRLSGGGGPWLIASLVAVWVLLWGDLSVANLLSGVVVAVAVVVVFPVGDVDPVRHRVRPLACLRLVAFFVGELLFSTVVVARDVLGGRARQRTAILACPLRVHSEGLVAMIANVLAISPGTTPIEVTQEPPVVHLHVLRLRNPDSVRRMVSLYEELVVAAVGSDADRAALAEAGRVQ